MLAEDIIAHPDKETALWCVYGATRFGESFLCFPSAYDGAIEEGGHID